MTLVVSAIDVTIILVLALAAMRLLRRQSAALRHCVLAAMLVGGALLPFIEPVLPDWRLPVQISAPVMTTASSAVAGDVAESRRSREASARVAPTEAPVDLITVLLRVWIVGSAIAFTALLFGFARLGHLTWTASRLSERRWLHHAEAIGRELGLRRPVTLLESRDPRLLVVWGLLRPRVLVPALARDWPDARIRVVLTHELAHVRRGDWSMQCLSELLRAVYWFNPLVWRACARLRQESDHACDDVVLTRGVEGSDYAAHLVDIARVLRRQRAWIPAPAIAHTSGFERRVHAMLNTQLNRRPPSRRAYAVTFAACLSLALSIAALTAAQTALVSFTGSVLDPSNAVLPNAVITLTNTETQAKYEVRTNRDGRYEIPGLPAGRYVLESRIPGFEAVKLELSVGAQNIDRDLKLELGVLQETITITTGGAVSPPKPMTPEERARFDERVQKRAEQGCPDAPRTSPAVGGNIRVPWKLRDKRPIYPAALASTGVSGKVVLQALIGTSGRVEEVTVESASHSEFAAAATDAVRQWEFDATLLNCVPVETRMTVSANFVQR